MQLRRLYLTMQPAGCNCASFDALKENLMHAPVQVLAVPDDTLPYQLISYTSGCGCSAVLVQDARPVAFWSCKMNSAEKNYHAGD